VTRPLRILHAPENTGANPQSLAEAERELGLDSWCVAFHPGAFGYRSDEVLWGDQPSLHVRELRRLRLLLRALRSFDVVHFNFGLTLMPPWVPPAAAPRDEENPWLRRIWRSYARLVEQRDLPLLKAARKGLVVTFQGDDARQGDVSSRFEVNSVADAGYYSQASDEHKRLRIARFARWADRIYSLNPDLLHVLPERARFMPYANIDPREWRPVPSQNIVPLVVHAPTHRGVKGTAHVLETVARLRRNGIRFDFALVENMDRVEARRLYERADVLVDQLLVGWYGGVAVEAMALGKTVVAYIREEDLRFLPGAMRDALPVISATPASLEGVLERLLTAPRETLAGMGARGRAYVERWHDPVRIADALRRDYEAIVGTPRRLTAAPSPR
jgi:glycosyltransferase involved in cell wall biosynthesis